LASDIIDILSTWGAVLRSSHQISVAASLGELQNKLAAASPDFVAFDRNLAPEGLVEAIKQIRKANSATKIVLLTEPGHQYSDQEVLALLKAGTRGFCSTDMGSDLIHKVLDAVDQGQVWVRSSFIPTLIEEIAKQAKRNINVSQDEPAGNAPEIPSVDKHEDSLSALTHREHEIAALIGRGECNKRIAQCLQISEQTVKAHLTVIFRKLNVTDRIHLALRVTQR
jgi:DNA-binding NarL/FixJ family response regulator